MGTKSPTSPTTSLKSRELIGVDAFSQRREVFGKHETVFLPQPASPNSMVPTVYKEVEPIITSNHGITTANFKRNTTGSSSFRDTKTDERTYDFRPRKYSDNFTSDLNQSDDVDNRYSALDRSRRLSKMRRDFLASNLHEPVEQQFTRAGMRASLPTGKTTALRYKYESLNIHKFPFAEPYATPPPTRKVILNSYSSETSNEVNGKENDDPELRPKHLGVPSVGSPTTADHQKLFDELVKRYSPQRKTINWTLPPTKPRVIGSVPKSTSSVDTVDKVEKMDTRNDCDDDVFEKKDNSITTADEKEAISDSVPNGPGVTNQATKADNVKNERDSKVSLTEIEEKNDRVPELSIIQSQISKEGPIKKPVIEVDLSIPALIDKMTEEGEKLESHTKSAKKVKRKRSFLDKLLGRKKDK